MKQLSTQRYLESLNDKDDLISEYGVSEDVRYILLNISGFKDLHRR